MRKSRAYRNTLAAIEFESLHIATVMCQIVTIIIVLTGRYMNGTTAFPNCITSFATAPAQIGLGLPLMSYPHEVDSMPSYFCSYRFHDSILSNSAPV
jgi:hypothetical protein